MKWEYKIVNINADEWSGTGMPADTGQRFDEWGADGWELVKVTPILRGGFLFFGLGAATKTAMIVAFFKRPIG
ncbi:MAG: DUF4177 domain-containing protein [Planctomycetota bacterium]